MQLDPPLEIALERRLGGRGGLEFGEVHVLQAHVDGGLGHVGRGIYDHVAREIALIHGERQRIEAHHTVRQCQMEFDLFERRLGGIHRSRFESHVGIHATHPIHLQIGVRQQIVRGRRSLRRRNLGRRWRGTVRSLRGVGGRGIPRRYMAECRRQIGQIQARRFQLCHQFRPRAVGEHRQIGVEVAGTDAALEIVDREFAARVLQASRDPVFRRVRQREIRQIVRVGQIVARDGEGAAVGGQIEGLGDRPLCLEAQRSGAEPGAETVRLVGIDVEQRAAGYGHRERPLIQMSLALQTEGGIASGRRLTGRERPVETQAADLIDHVNLAVVHQEQADCRQMAGGRGAEIPAGPALAVALQIDHRIRQFDPRQDELALQQVQQTQLDDQPVHGEHAFAVRPVRIVDAHALGVHRGIERPRLHRQVSDGGGASGPVRDHADHRRP